MPVLDLTGSVLLLAEATVVPLEPVAGAGTGVATRVVVPVVVEVAEVVEVAVVGTLADPDAGALRVMTPTFGATTLEFESEATDAPDELLDPSAPHAARPTVRRPHSTTLRMCERATQAKFFMFTTPVVLTHFARAATRGSRATCSVAGRDPDNGNHCWFAGNPAILRS